MLYGRHALPISVPDRHSSSRWRAASQCFEAADTNRMPRHIYADLLGGAMNQSRKTRIAHLAGPTATIQNTPPLVTSNKARVKHGLPLLKDADGAALRHDALRPQRLAAPARVYVEQFSAHPLESDVAELYGPPDGYIGADGVFRKQRQDGRDKPVYEIELKPEDGLYPLPYMATQ